MNRFSLAAGAVLAASVMAAGPAAAIAITQVWSFDHTSDARTEAGKGVLEIVAHDPATASLWVAGPTGIDVLDAKTGAFEGAIAFGGDTGSPNSVAIRNGVAAVAITSQVRTDPGFVNFYNTTTRGLIASVTVGANPDMVTFTPDGKRLLVANEGEPSDDYTVDPQGSISVIDVSGGVDSFVVGEVTTVGFASYNGEEDSLRTKGIRIYGPGANTSQDLEPEYIAVSPDGSKAYVTLQENNALAIVDLTDLKAAPTLVPLGLKNHNWLGKGLDPSDRDGPDSDGTPGRTGNWPVSGMYQPDGIAAFEVDGKTYLITANEGDAREWGTFVEEARVGSGSYKLDEGAFPNAVTLKQSANLGRLNASTKTGDIDGDGDFDQIHSLGGRSFSILDATGALVFESGDLIERIIDTQYPWLWVDSRSDNKGPEPEGVEVMELFDRFLAFVGLERFNAVMAFDITDPTSPFFLALIDEPGSFPDIEKGPEGMEAFTAGGVHFLAVANEDGRTTTLYRVPAPGTLTLLGLGIAALGAIRRKKISAQY